MPIISGRPQSFQEGNSNLDSGEGLDEAAQILLQQRVVQASEVELCNRVALQHVLVLLLQTKSDESSG